MIDLPETEVFNQVVPVDNLTWCQCHSDALLRACLTYLRFCVAGKVAILLWHQDPQIDRLVQMPLYLTSPLHIMLAHADFLIAPNRQQRPPFTITWRHRIREK